MFGTNKCWVNSLNIMVIIVICLSNEVYGHAYPMMIYHFHPELENIIVNLKYWTLPIIILSTIVSPYDMLINRK